MVALSKDYLRSRLRYEPETGKLFWRPRPLDSFKSKSKNAHSIWHNRFCGKEAFTATNFYGYRVGGLDGKIFLAHRIIWAMHHGDVPTSLDHINGDREDNRIENLRPASRASNQRNLGLSSCNTSGHTGVRAIGKKWRASITVNGNFIHLGVFDFKEDAIKARQRANEMYGFHENHGTKRKKYKAWE